MAKSCKQCSPRLKVSLKKRKSIIIRFKTMDVPGASTVSYFIPRKATDNFLRLCRLITGLCSDLFRVILSYYIKPPYLRKELDNNRTKLERVFNVQQKELIYPATRNPTLFIEDFDISILYILLRNICNIPKHKNGWGNDPKKGDNSIAACIERIRCQRNVVFAHSSGMVEDTKFQNTWSELRYSIVEIEKQLIGGKLFQGSVEFLYNCDICIVQRGMNRSEDKGVQANLQPDHVESENNSLDTLGTFYDDSGRAIRFANLFDEISHSVPQEKIDQMKVLIQNSCKIKNIAGLKNAISARDCLTILRDANLFNSKDVICVQFLMKKIDCEELFTKCYEYAEKENVLCFHEKPLEHGCRNVYFHVHGELEDYGPRQVEKIKATVAAIVECSSDKILFGGICPSSSFLLVLSIENALVVKLLEIGQEDKAKLIKLNIDYFIVDLTIVYLECPKGYVWNIYFGSNDINFSKNERIHCKKGQPTMPFLQKDNTALTTLSQDLLQKDLGDSSTAHQPPARFKGRYTTLGTQRGGRWFKPRTPQGEEYHGPGAGNNMSPSYPRDSYYYGQYSAWGPCPQGGPTYVSLPPFPPKSMNHYQQITPPPYLSPTVSNIHSSYTQDVHEARQPIQGNATISERDPVEFLLELRPLTTFFEKITTSDHLCFTVEVDGREFRGYGMTKIGAKHNAAIDALRYTFNIVCTNTVDSDSDNESIASEVSNADCIANPRQHRTIQRFSDVQDEMEKNVFTFLVKECGGCTSTAIFKEKFNGLREDFDEWILNRKTILAVYKKAGRATYIAPLFKDAKVCCFYGGNKSCRHQNCRHFHICKFDLFGRCRKGTKCLFEHSFEKGNNRDLKFRLSLDAFTDKEIKIILQCRYPQVCPASQCEAPSPNDCPFLHTCFNFLKNRCKDSTCEKGHTLSDRHNQWVLSVYGMKKWPEQKLKPLICLRKLPNDDTKTVSPDEEHDLASDFESFLVMDEAEEEDDDNVDVYNGEGHRLKLM